MCDKLVKERKCSGYIRRPEIGGAAREGITRTPRRNVLRLITTDMGFKEHCVENPSDDLFLPYEVHLGHPLPEDKIARIYAFARAFERYWNTLYYVVLRRSTLPL